MVPALVEGYSSLNLQSTTATVRASVWMYLVCQAPVLARNSSGLFELHHRRMLRRYPLSDGVISGMSLSLGALISVVDLHVHAIACID